VFTHTLEKTVISGMMKHILKARTQPSKVVQSINKYFDSDLKCQSLIEPSYISSHYSNNRVHIVV
jgi:hypothetical protein